MNWDEVFKIVTSALGAAGGAGLIIFSLSSWLSRVWASRILEADRSKYSREMESLKLSNQNLVNSLSLTNSAYLESKKVFTEKRIEAVQTVWSQLIRLRDERPSPIVFLDLLSKDEYPQIATNPKFSWVKKETEIEKITSIIHNDVDMARPFLDERSYQLYWGYRVLIGRFCFFINNLFTNPSINDWREEKSIKGVIETILSNDELSVFREKQMGAIELFQYLETIMANHLRSLSSGADLASETLEHSLSFNKSASEILKSEIEEKI